MVRCWRVYIKTDASSPWRDTGIIESNREAASSAWAAICRKLRRHSFKLEPITYGVAYARQAV